MTEITHLLKQFQPVLSPILIHLKPVINSAPQELIDYGYQLYTKPVFDEVVLNLNLFDNEAYVKHFIATTLSFGIVAFGGLVKLPQILTILKNKSAAGLSFLSLTLDTLSQLITVAYNFRHDNPFITFGEIALVSLQNVLILILVLLFSGGRFISTFVGVLSYIVYSLFSTPEGNKFGVFTNSQVNELFKLAIPLNVLAKLPQILNNFKNKSTGQLSLVSVAAGLLGILVRIFTLINERDITDLTVIGALISGALNLILLLQILTFGADKKPKVSHEKKTR